MTKNKNIHTFVVLAYKESEYLEDCIKSVINQTKKTNVVIATSTPNDYINDIAKKYKLKVIVNPVKKGIGYDFDFAINAINSSLITVAHQDDIYENTYYENIFNAYQEYEDSIIIFSDYFEVRNGNRLYKNKNLKIKRVLLFLLRFKGWSNYGFIKRSCLRFGCAICCPSVTFVRNNCPKEVFTSKYRSDVDWYAWEKLSKIKGRFTFINKCLMGHRIHDGSETTNIINDNVRIKEDEEMFNKFWPQWITKILLRVYKKSEESN